VAAADDVSALFSTYHDRVYRYLLSLVHSPADAEDLTQETFLRAYSRREALRDANAVRGWLYRIATRACLDRWRERAEPVAAGGEGQGPTLDAVPSGAPSALEVVEREETGACVQRCLDFLPDHYRAVILLHQGHSLTAVEIAGLLHESVGTVKIRLHRARRKLREVMEIGCAVSQGRDGVPCCEPKGREE